VRTVSERILRKLTGRGGGRGVDAAGSGQDPVAGSCEYGEEYVGSGATELVG
jgi:hypothetical protein